jgi:aldehyde:ferredoxin oxidoreductase
MMKAGERALNMMRAFNAREGFTKKDDVLPAKLFQPLSGGASNGLKITEEEIVEFLPLYYKMCGWDQDGSPTGAKLEELGLGWILEDLQQYPDT